MLFLHQLFIISDAGSVFILYMEIFTFKGMILLDPSFFNLGAEMLLILEKSKQLGKRHAQ